MEHANINLLFLQAKLIEINLNTLTGKFSYKAKEEFGTLVRVCNRLLKTLNVLTKEEENHFIESARLLAEMLNIAVDAENQDKGQQFLEMLQQFNKEQLC